MHLQSKLPSPALVRIPLLSPRDESIAGITNNGFDSFRVCRYVFKELRELLRYLRRLHQLNKKRYSEVLTLPRSSANFSGLLSRVSVINDQ